MQVMARACGHSHLHQFNADDVTTWNKAMAELAGIQFAGVGTETGTGYTQRASYAAQSSRTR